MGPRRTTNSMKGLPIPLVLKRNFRTNSEFGARMAGQRSWGRKGRGTIAVLFLGQRIQGTHVQGGGAPAERTPGVGEVELLLMGDH